MNNLYDDLLKSIKDCVREISFEQLKDCKRLLIVAVNEEGIIKTLLQSLFDANFNIEIAFVAQSRMIKTLREITTEETQIIEWQGAYTDQLVDYVKSRLENFEPDGFLHFCNQPVDLRNNNLLNIAQAFKNKPDFGIYSMDGEGMLYKYRNIALYNRGIHLYEEINAYIDLCLNAEAKHTDIE